MKKALFVAALIGSMVASADTDSYLYWMIGSGAPSYKYAKVRAIDNTTTWLNNYYDFGTDSIGTEVSDTVIASQAAWDDGIWAGVDSSALPSSIVIELYNDSGFVAQSVLSGLDGYIYKGGTGTPVSTPAMATSFAIPEPSSGLLMLVGFAVLGLRRRRQKNA